MKRQERQVSFVTEVHFYGKDHSEIKAEDAMTMKCKRFRT
jgi:hypothetical protein